MAIVSTRTVHETPLYERDCASNTHLPDFLRGASCCCSWIVTQNGYVTIGLLMGLASVFEVEPRATPATIRVTATPHFGTEQCPMVLTARLRTLRAGFPVSRVACKCACYCVTYRGWAFLASYLQGAHLDCLEVAYALHVKTYNGRLSLSPRRRARCAVKLTS